LFITDQSDTEFGNARLPFGGGNYHGLDYPVFHMDVRENAKLRVATYFSKIKSALSGDERYASCGPCREPLDAVREVGAEIVHLASDLDGRNPAVEEKTVVLLHGRPLRWRR